jgi:hypothetical protein
MVQELPVACSLSIGGLEQRLAEIGELGARSLVDRKVQDDRHVLRFRSDSQTRGQLEAIVEAERECCAFLDLSLREEGGYLILSVAAPEAGQSTADGFALAFSSPSC